MISKQRKMNHPHLFFMVFLVLISQGCSSKYTQPSLKYPRSEGEVNQHVREIKAEKEQIFHILTDEKSFGSICPKGTIVAHESLPPYQIGSKVQTKIDHIFNLTWHTQVIEIVPNKKIRLQFLDGFFAGGTEIWELESKGKQVRTTHTIIFKFNGFIKKWIWRLKVRRKHDIMVEAFLDNLKLLAETGSTN
ncbi:MAG: hypothetical protein JSW04_06675 [Desulfobacterales bacterium]|nr:MAG: hypothetical protein JSW04_06675 [Desulfobacterales bacterium]